MPQRPLIGQILVADGALSEGALARALGYQRATRQSFRLGSILLEWDILAEDKLLEGLSKLHRCPPVTWAELSRTSPEALQVLSAAFAMRLGAFPYALEGTALRVAFRNPSDLAIVDEISSVSRRRLIPGVATEAALVLAYHRFYGRPVPPDFRDVIHKFERGRATPARPRAARFAVPAPSAVPEAKKASRGTSPPAVAMERLASSRIERPKAPSVEQRDSGQPMPMPAPASTPQPSPRRATAAAVPDAESKRARIAESVVERLFETLPRVIVLGVGKSAISGWTGRGPGLTPEIVAALRVRSSGESVLPDVARSGEPHFGPLEPERLSFALRGMLERETPGCAVFPIRVSDMVAGILYADRLGDPMLDGDSALLSEAARTLEKLFSGSSLSAGETA